MADAKLNFVQVEGHSIAYRDAGQGPVLVLLHGFLCDSQCWRRQVADLSDRFRVVAWDAPGAGSSSDSTEPFTTADYARCLARFLDELGVVRAHVLGLSWGGILAQEFYRMYPQRLRCLVLADTYAGWKGSLPELVWRERLASCLRDAIAPSSALVAKMLPGIFSDGAPQDIQDEQSTIMSEFHPVGYRLMSISSAEADTRDLLPRIQVPTLLLWGDMDRRSPVHVAEQLHAAIPGAELAVIPEAGHLSNMEQAEVFNVRSSLLSEPRHRVITSRIVMSITSDLSATAILEKPVGDRGTLEDVSQSPCSRSARDCKLLILNGEMSEWLKEHAWKLL